MKDPSVYQRHLNPAALTKVARQGPQSPAASRELTAQAKCSLCAHAINTHGSLSLDTLPSSTGNVSYLAPR